MLQCAAAQCKISAAVQFPIFYLLSAAIYLTIWSSLLHRGVRTGMLRKYKLFYAWVVTTAIAEATAMVGSFLWGFEAWPYVHVYFVGILASGLLAACLIGQIHRMIGKAHGWFIGALSLASLFLLDARVSSESILYWLLVGTLHSFLCVAGLAAVWRLYRNPSFSLGRNYSAILAAIVFPSALVAFNHLAYFSHFPHWSVAVFGHLHEPIRMGSWLVVFLGMRIYDPPSRGPEEDQNRILEEVKLRLKTLRSWT